MVGYITLGTNDRAKAKAFYDDLLSLIGANCFEPNDRIVMWGTPGKTFLGVAIPWDEKAASAGNGTMVALNVESKENVDKLYTRALELNGTDEGGPGMRNDNFYGAYFRDLDGNKLAVYCLI